MNAWKFHDPPNVAVIATRQVVEGEDWIAYVSHDEDDGSWQFHRSSKLSAAKDAIVVSLREVVERDPTISDLADLPRGWCAWRDSVTSPWFRERISDSGGRPS